MSGNGLKNIREARMMSKAELARKAEVSPITVSRIEEGKSCRLQTQRKIITALGIDFSEASRIFGKMESGMRNK